jgi:hypothetical protein
MTDMTSSVPADRTTPSASAAAAQRKPEKVPPKINALTHGVYAEERVLPWEDPRDLMKLRDEVWEEYQVNGRSEEETALGLVWQFWLKRRVARAVQLSYYLGLPTEDRESPPESFDEMLGRVVNIADQHGALSTAAKEAIEKITKAAEGIFEITKAISSHSADERQNQACEAADKARREAEFVGKMFTQQVFPRLTKLEEASRTDGPRTVYEKAYSHSELEKLSRIDAMLDARIDKQLARLVRLQEYKCLRASSMKVVEQSAPA